ncbi:DUF427 domain-containing protein [Alloalcanivorax mobilis]|uniref:DUF427 domain-containing protein n=1 Tax=Alloalcanivorax mobilis TaxID=2019569 RepID=UPI000C789483|nr:DUF427 domain-containing protein [Alloalcanivorax mobilis]
MTQPPTTPEAHRITLAPTPGRVIVTVASQVIADSQRALTLREGNLPPVQYLPRDDVDMSRLTRTTHTSHCPFKGDANYYSIATAEGEANNAVWTYEQPLPGVEAIRDYLAFYAERVESIRIEP